MGTQSVSFPVKRSVLATRRMSVPEAFHVDNSAQNKLSSTSFHTVTKRNADALPVSADCNEVTWSTADQSPKRLKTEADIFHASRDIKDGAPAAEVHKKSADSQSKQNLNSDNGATLPSQNVRKHNLNSDECVIDEAHKPKPKESTSCTGEASQPVNLTTTTSSLVSYNSSGDERPTDKPSETSGKHTRKHKRKGSYPGRSKKKLSGAAASIDADRRAEKSFSPSRQTADNKDVKVTKGTSKSTWDSSDSDFDSTIAVDRQKAKTNIARTSPKNSQSVDTHTRSREPKKQKHISEKLKFCDRPAISPEAKVKKSIDDVQCDARSCHTSHRSPERKRRASGDRRNNLKKRTRKRRSNSSASPVRDPPGGVRKRDNSSNARRYGRSRSHSPDTHSSRSSVTDSRESSYRSTRRARHRRRRSNSYTSQSSRRSSASTRSIYRGRSPSSSSHSGGHRRYRSRSSYRHRRRYRRRSYSSRSPTRSHSRRFSDSSSRYSSKSSHSSLSSRASSRNSRHALITTGYSRHSRERSGQKHHKSAVASDNPHECRGENGRCTTSSSEFKTETPPTGYRFTSSSVADTVSAAVRRVTGARLSTKKTNSPVTGVHNTGLQDKKLKYCEDKLYLSPEDQSTTSIVVDIPLPKDSDPPYIGPQLSPELAERFGLPLSRATAEVVNENIQAKPLPDVTEATGAASDGQPLNCASHEVDIQRNTSEFTIPPEKAEQYKALQEQAKQHALRRHNLLTANSSESEFRQQQQHQLMLLQQQIQSGTLIHPESLVVPTVSLVPVNPMIGAYGVTTFGSANQSNSTVDHWTNQLATAIQARQIASTASVLGTQQQMLAAAVDVPTQHVLGAVTQANGLSTLMTSRQLSSADQPSGVFPKTVPSIDSNQAAAAAIQQMQQLQLAAALHYGGLPAQLIQAAASAQSVPSAPSAAATATLTNKLLQHLALQQQQKAAGPQFGIPAISNLIAQQQQLQLIAQLQRQATAVDSLRLASIASGSGDTVTPSSQGDQSQTLPGSGTCGPLAILLQQHRLAALQQQSRPVLATSVANQGQSGTTMATLVNASGISTQNKASLQQYPSAAEIIANPVSRLMPSTPTNVATAAVSLAQQQQLQALQAIAAAQQNQQRLTAINPDQALLTALAAQRRQQQLLQAQLMQQQQQQQQQQAMAASAFLAAQLQQQQRQQPPQQ